MANKHLTPPNLFDRAVAYLSPARGLRRLQARHERLDVGIVLDRPEGPHRLDLRAGV